MLKMINMVRIGSSNGDIIKSFQLSVSRSPTWDVYKLEDETPHGMVYFPWYVYDCGWNARFESGWVVCDGNRFNRLGMISEEHTQIQARDKMVATQSIAVMGSNLLTTSMENENRRRGNVTNCFAQSTT